MMKNKLIAIGAISLLGAGTAAAQEEWSVTTSFTYESAYMFRGLQLAEHTYFPSVDVAYGPFYAGIWGAFPVDTANDNEIDFYAGYGFELSEMVSLDLGATFYTFPGDGETLEFYTGFAFATPYSPAFYVYYDIDLKDLTLEASAGHSIEIAENLTFDLSAALGHVFVDDGKDYTYAVGTVGFGFAISQAASLAVYSSYSIASEDYVFQRGSRIRMDDDKLWFGVSVTAGF